MQIILYTGVKLFIYVFQVYYLLKVLEKRIEEGKSSGKALSIAMFDMDNFKSVNELLGYETGDMFI